MGFRAGFAVLVTFMAVAAAAQAQDWPSWRVVDGTAMVRNDAAQFGVTCADAGTPALMLEAPDAAPIPEGSMVLLQVSSRADAYAIDDATRISTFLRPFRPRPEGGYISDRDPAALAPLIDDLRAGLNLIVAVEAFDRSQRFTLVGSRRSIDAALDGCG